MAIEQSGEPVAWRHSKELNMDENKVVKLTSFDLPPKLITAINAFDGAMVKAIDDVIESGVHRGMIVGMLHAYAHEQTRRMVEEGYA